MIRRSNRWPGLLALAFALAGCPKPLPPEPPPAASADEFTLGSGDTFEVKVYGEQDLSGSYRVAPDGTVDYPLIGQVHVEGMLPHAVAQLLVEKLKDGYLVNPQVSVTVREQASKKIMILGQVGHPGTFPYVQNMTIVEGITQAGGFTQLAAKNDTTVTRADSGKEQSTRVPVDQISEGKAQNFYLRPGDIIRVPERVF